MPAGRARYSPCLRCEMSYLPRMASRSAPLAPVKVFISYSHDSPEHSARVLELAHVLGDMGLHIELDQFETGPPQGWQHWCTERLRPDNARFVLMICTPTYRARVENCVALEIGRAS